MNILIELTGLSRKSYKDRVMSNSANLISRFEFERWAVDDGVKFEVRDQINSHYQEHRHNQCLQEAELFNY